MEKENVLNGFNVHNQNVLVKVSVKLGTLVLNGLIGNKNEKVLQSLSSAINDGNKIIVAVSKKSEFNEFIGKEVIIEDNAVPEMRTINSDKLDLDNVLKDFKHDFKQGSSLNNGILYPVNIYFTIKEYQIVMTKDIKDESN